MRFVALSLIALSIALPGAAQGTGLAGVDPSGARITFWYQHSGDRDKAMQAMIQDFNSTNPWKITVRGEYAGPYDQVYNKMVAALAAGKPPELVVAYQNQAATYDDALVDLNPYVNDAKWGIVGDLGDFFTGFINQDISAQLGGKRLGFPPNRSIEVLYYNEPMLRQAGISRPPRTWDEFADDCRRVTDTAQDTYGYALDSLDASHIFAFVISRGGSFTTPDGKGYALDSRPMKDSMLFMRRLVAGGWARKIAKKFDDQSEFGNARSAFAISSTSGLPYYDAAVKAGRKGTFPWNIGPVPQLQPSGAPAIDLYGASVSVPKTTPQKELAAWLFIRWFSEPRQQAAWTHVSLYFPVRKSVEPLIRDILSSNPRFSEAWELLKRADLRSEPSFPGYDLVRDAISAAYNRVLDGSDVDSVLNDLQAQAQKILKDSSP
ncbi:MAG TPA: ABC transporter substrate-binding protein [Spirochaetia bacterium]|nr:ABC transporter substrate-binding protein [Spirochaetia bacterium]